MATLSCEKSAPAWRAGSMPSTPAWDARCAVTGMISAAPGRAGGERSDGAIVLVAHDGRTPHRFERLSVSRAAPPLLVEEVDASKFSTPRRATAP